jgi:hypothetical protein
MITTLSEVKQYLNIPSSDTSQDAKITALILVVESDYLWIRNKPFEMNGGIIVYPTGANITAVQMVGYRLSNFAEYQYSAGSGIARNGEISSESWGDHSVSYDTSTGKVETGSGSILGYPKSIVEQIGRYANFHRIKFPKYKLDQEKYNGPFQDEINEQ